MFGFDMPRPKTALALKLWSDEQSETLVVAETAEAAAELSGLSDRGWYSIPDDIEVRIKQEWPEPGTQIAPDGFRADIEVVEGVAAELGEHGLWVRSGDLYHTAPAAMWTTYGRGFYATVEPDA